MVAAPGLEPGSTRRQILSLMSLPFLHAAIKQDDFAVLIKSQMH